MAYRDLAKKIETFMFVQGEYDYADNDRNKWVRGVADDYAVNDPDVLFTARNEVREKIIDDLHNGDIKPLIRYMAREYRLLITLEELTENDELVKTANEIIAALKDELARQPVKEFDFTGCIDGKESIEDTIKEGPPGYNFQLCNYNKDLFDRAEFEDESIIYEDFKQLCSEYTDITLNVTATITADENVFVEITYQDDSLDKWPTGEVQLTEREKQSLRADMNRVARYQDTSLEELIGELKEFERE